MIVDFISDMLSMTGSYYVEISLGIIFILFLFYLYTYSILSLRPILRDLKAINDFFTGLPSLDKSNDKIINDFLDGRNKSPLQRVWQQHALYPDSFKGELADVFNYEQVISHPARRKRAETVPAVLASIGILLAFVGLLGGMQAIDITENGMNELVALLGGLLLLPVCAIILSLFYQILDRNLFDKTTHAFYIMHSHLKHISPADGETTLTDKLSDVLDNFTQKLDAYGKQTVSIQNAGMEILVNIFIQNLNIALNDQFTALGKTMEELSKAQLKGKEQMDSLLQELAQGITSQYNINRSTEAIVHSITKYHEQITASSKGLSEGLFQIRDLSLSLKETLDLNKGLLEEVKSDKASLKSDYDKYLDNIHDQIQKLQKDSNIEIERVITKFADVSGKTLDRIEGSIIQSMDSWTNSNKTMLQNMEGQSKSMVSTSLEIAQRLNELSSQLNVSVKSFTDAIYQGTTHTISEFDEGLADITQRFSSTIIEIRDAIDELPEAIDALKNHIK